MRHIVPLIWEAVGTSIANGTSIDVDALCHEFLELHPELTRKQIEDVIREAVAAQNRTVKGGGDETADDFMAGLPSMPRASCKGSR